MAEDTKLYRHIRNELAAAIAAGDFAVGSRLPPERKLTDRYKVSRPTIREAIIALEIDGLVIARRGAGVFVTARSTGTSAPISDIGAFELVEARRLIEGEAAAAAACEIKPSQLEELRRLIDEMESGNKDVSEQADRGFHILIAQASGNVAIGEVVASLWDRCYRSPLARGVMVRVKGLGVSQRVSEHRMILAALERGSPGGARDAMREHLARVIEHLLEMTEQDAIEIARASVARQRRRLGTPSA